MAADGTWNITMNTPMGAQQGTLNLATDGGTLSGNMTGAQGSMDIENGSADGDNLTWSCNMTSPMPMKLDFSAAVDGDSISGNVALGAFGNASFSGERA